MNVKYIAAMLYCLGNDDKKERACICIAQIQIQNPPIWRDDLTKTNTTELHNLNG